MNNVIEGREIKSDITQIYRTDALKIKDILEKYFNDNDFNIQIMSYDFEDDSMGPQWDYTCGDSDDFEYIDDNDLKLYIQDSNIFDDTDKELEVFSFRNIIAIKLLATIKLASSWKKSFKRNITSGVNEDLEAALKEVEDLIDNAGDYDDVEELEMERQDILKKLNRQAVKSARFIIEDEMGEVIAEADTYEEAQSVGGAKIIDTINSSRKPLKSSSDVGDIHDSYVLGNITEDTAFQKLKRLVGIIKAKNLLNIWKDDFVYSSKITSSVEKAVREAEEYFGTEASDTTVICQDILTQKDNQEMKDIAEKNDVEVQIGKFSVTFYNRDDVRINE